MLLSNDQTNTMKKFHPIYILGFVVLFSAGNAGCKKQLNLLPLDQLSDAAFFKTPNDYKVFANQYYSWTKNFTTLPGILDNPHSDGRSDLFGGGGSFGAGTIPFPTRRPISVIPATGPWTTPG